MALWSNAYGNKNSFPYLDGVKNGSAGPSNKISCMEEQTLMTWVVRGMEGWMGSITDGVENALGFLYTTCFAYSIFNDSAHARDLSALFLILSCDEVSIFFSM